MLGTFRIASVLLVVLTVFLGGVYPLVVTLLAQWMFEEHANGSLIVRDGHVRGSSLIGQSFTQAKYFWGRPSAVADGSTSAASNIAVASPEFRSEVAGRVASLRASSVGAGMPNVASHVPADLVMASGSGLDPHITEAAAAWQVDRVARARRMPTEVVRDLVAREVAANSGWFSGPRHVNVLELNLALDAWQPRVGSTSGSP